MPARHQSSIRPHPLPFFRSRRVTTTGYCGAVTKPTPRSSGSLDRPLVPAVASSLAVTRLAVALTPPDLLRASHHRAATPATCGQAMLVPFIDTSPPPNFAERISTPGAASCDIVFEKFATSNVPAAFLPTAATEMIPRDAAGSDAATVKSGR
jgi:hypothetical protein